MSFQNGHLFPQRQPLDEMAGMMQGPRRPIVLQEVGDTTHDIDLTNPPHPVPTDVCIRTRRCNTAIARPDNTRERNGEDTFDAAAPARPVLPAAAESMATRQRNNLPGFQRQVSCA